jgi:hypothetical protein
LEVGDCHGVWGATTPRERRAMLVAWRAENTNAPCVRGEAPPKEIPAAESRTVLALIPKQRTMVDLVGRVAS